MKHAVPENTNFPLRRSSI